MAQIYRVGKDIFDASTNQKIANPTVLANQYKGATEVKAPSIPTGATKIAGPSGLQGLNESQIFRSGQDIYRLPPIPTQVSGEQLTGGVPNVPVAEETDNSSVDSLMAGIQAGQAGLEAQIAERNRVLPEQQKKTELQTRFEKESGELYEGQKADTEKVTAEVNIPGLENARTENLIKYKQAEGAFNQAVAAEKGRKGLAGSIYGRQALIKEQKAIELGTYAAIDQAYNQRISTAYDTIEKAINIKYKPQEDYIANLKSQIEFIQGDLTEAEKKRAENVLAVAKERENIIKKEKDRETEINKVMLLAAQAGADSGTLQQIMKATDYMSAIQLASKYLDQTETTWEESEVLDANGNPMLFNPSTGEYKTAVGTSTSDIYFTDANGDSWNIAGWATDQTKPQQMNAIAKRIGKLTDENLAEKVKEFAPGLTADMIKEASAMSGVSWEAIMTMVNQEAQGGLSNVAKNNNNFGGLTFNNQEWIKPYGGEKGTEKPEGGNYIKFPTKQAGLNAMANLMAQYGKVESIEPVKNSAQNWADLINKGEAKITDVPANERTEVTNALALTPKPQDQELDLIAKEKAQIASTLKSHNGLKNAVGTIDLGRKAPFQWGQKADFIASVEQLVSDLSLESLIDAKSRGATFGALSDSEMRILASAATKIGTWRLRDEDGNITGYKASESAFKDELDNISKIFLRAVKGNELNQSTNTIQTSTPIMIGQTPDGMGYQVIE